MVVSSTVTKMQKSVKLSHVVKNASFNLYIDPADVESISELDGGGALLTLKSGRQHVLDVSARSANKLVTGQD